MTVQSFRDIFGNDADLIQKGTAQTKALKAGRRAGYVTVQASDVGASVPDSVKLALALMKLPENTTL